MNKLSYLLLGAGLFTLASCSNEDLIGSSDSNGLGNVTLEVEVPSLQTRSFGDGTTATYLQYAVYEVNSDGSLKKVVEPVETQLENKAKQINLQLLTQRNYKVVFWAGVDSKSASGSSKLTPYIVNFGDENVVMTCDQDNYNTKYWKINNDNLDAFFATKDIYMNGDLTEKVELTRATAQINIGTNDYDRAKELKLFDDIKDLNSEVRINNVYTKLNLVTGKAEDPINKKFYFGDLDQDFIDQPFPVEGDYKYLALVYAIVGTDQELVTVSYGYDTAISTLNADDHPVQNVPVQRNHRTNIYGSLFTDEYNVNVEINDKFDDPSYDQNLDNLIQPGVFYDENLKTYTITSAEGLKWIAAQNNALPNNTWGRNGTTIQLGCDIDLGNQEWTPMTLNDGIFDGKNFSIKNFTVDLTSSENQDKAAGFFSLAVGSVKNLTIEGATIKGTYKAGVVAGDGTSGNFENVHVKNSTVTSVPWLKDASYYHGSRVGGLVGYLTSESNAKVVNCSVEDVAVKAFNCVGGLVGYAGVEGNAIDITGNSLKNVKVIADLSVNAYDISDVYCDKIVAETSGTVNISDNNLENVQAGVVKKGENQNEFVANNFDDLEVLAYLGSNYYAGKTILLQNDIDFEGKDFNPVAFWSSNKVTIDGQNHTISNITLKDGRKCVFGTTQANIKNFKVKGIKGDVGHEDAFVGFISNLYGDIENVHVEDVDINPSFINNPSGTLSYQISALVGIFNSGNMKNCSVKNASFAGGREIGALAGSINETSNRTIENCHVENIKIYTNAGWFGLLSGGINSKLTGIVFKDCSYSGTNKYTFGSNFVDVDLNMGIRYPEAAFKWNDTNVTKGIKSAADWEKLWSPSNN